MITVSTAIPSSDKDLIMEIFSKYGYKSTNLGLCVRHWLWVSLLIFFSILMLEIYQIWGRNFISLPIFEVVMIAFVLLGLHVRDAFHVILLFSIIALSFGRFGGCTIIVKKQRELIAASALYSIKFGVQLAYYVLYTVYIKMRITVTLYYRI